MQKASDGINETHALVHHSYGERVSGLPRNTKTRMFAAAHNRFRKGTQRKELEIRRERLFPLDGSRRFRSDVIDDPVDTVHFVDDPRAGAAQKLMAEIEIIRSHSVH